MAMSEAGHVAVAWQTGPLFDGGLVVALSEPGEGFGAPQQIADPSPSPGDERGAVAPSIAVDHKGNAVVAWQTPGSGQGGFDTYAAYRPSGGRFGRPERLWDSRARQMSSVDALAAIDREGEATVLFAADGLQATSRARHGSFGPSERVGPPGSPTALVSNAAGQQFAAWGGRSPGSPVYVAARSSEGRFLSPIRLPVPDGATTQIGLDSRGNVLAILVDDPAHGQRLSAGTFTRFGFAPLELTPPLTTVAAVPSPLAVNEAGAAAAIFDEYPPGFNGESGTPVRIIDRPADRDEPDLQLSVSDRAGGRIALALRCDEACRVRGEFRAGAPGAARAAPRRSRRSVTLRAGTRGRLVVRLSRAERRRIRRHLRGGVGSRVSLRVTVDDSFGNRRVARRRLKPGRLLR